MSRFIVYPKIEQTFSRAIGIVQNYCYCYLRMTLLPKEEKTKNENIFKLNMVSCLL
jgi:hypothetical protein